jgi:predicted ATPase/class 3 adenylate cyclase
VTNRGERRAESAVPAGTVTFLFTDIEGSTRLWEENPEAMRVALARHDELLREAIESQGGHVFKTVGDAFCAAFQHASNAVEAAARAQTELSEEAMPDGLVLAVRMAVHTGSAESRDADYFGRPLNRVARLLAIGHGGQVLLSEVTQSLCRDSLPPNSTVAALGEHRLKDLGRPECVFQLCASGLRSEFPPLRSLDSAEMPNNLPLQPTSFIGREKELRDIALLLGRSSLVTIAGAGGSGKTRLALQVAAELLDAYPEGAWLVELAPLADPSLVDLTVAGVLRVKEAADKSVRQTLTGHLNGKTTLIVLDNCEHVLDASARLADAILHNCPGVRILATSREALGVMGEQIYRVPSLSLPDPVNVKTAEALQEFESVRLFAERAELQNPGFTITDSNAPAIASICTRLDGIPLAIELAAARVRSLTVEDINGKLDQRFRLLTGGSRTALPRQQTLRSLIDWSYDLLDSPEKALLCRLSVFSGGFTLDMAERACGGGEVDDWEVLDLVTSLADKSLVSAETAGFTARYRLLETVRQYARDRLLESGESGIWRDRHMHSFLAIAEESEPLLNGAEQKVWLERLEAEHDNLRAALEWGCGHPDHAEVGLRMAGALGRFWLMHAHFSEGRRWLHLALGLEGARSRTAARAAALNAAGNLAMLQGDHSAAEAAYTESLAIRRELGNPTTIAGSLSNLGSICYERGEIVAARKLYEESLAIRRELGDQAAVGESLNNLGIVAHEERDYEAARLLHEESLAIKVALGNRWSAVPSHNNLGRVAFDLEDYATARIHHIEALKLSLELTDRAGMASSLERLAAAVAMLGDPMRASLIWGATERLREELESTPNPGFKPIYDGTVAAARSQVDAVEFDRAWQSGRDMPFDEAIALALA